MMVEILATVNLTKAYGVGNARVEALKAVNLSIRQGEFVAVVGPSGSGKSTLLHLLGGLDQPTSGGVIIDGQEIYTLPERELSILRRRKVGFVFQFFNLIPVLTVEENVTLPLLLDGKEVEQSYIEDLIGLLGLKERRNHLPNELSGGQQQRVSIGRALASKPAIIFADEPTGNLDRKNGREVMELMRLSVQKYHQTLVMITHDLDIASQADRIIRLEDGMIVNGEAL
jgi:putative ABC transport system ATP-binding protein